MQSHFKLSQKQLGLFATVFVIGFTFYILMYKKKPRDYTKYKWYQNESGRKMIDKLHPKFRPLIKDWMSDVEDKLGLEIYPTSGYRTYAEQARLYAKNNSNGKPGYSYHNFGLALDVNVKKDNKIIILKDDNNDKWKQSGIVYLANKNGIIWKGDFGNYHDPVHFQYNLGSLTSKDLRSKYDSGKKDSNGYVLI